VRVRSTPEGTGSEGAERTLQVHWVHWSAPSDWGRGALSCLKLQGAEGCVRLCGMVQGVGEGMAGLALHGGVGG